MQKGKVVFLIGGILIIISLFMAFWFKKEKTETMETKTLCFNEHCFLAQVAKTKAQRTKGLMFREKLTDNEAMLFVFETSGVHNFWMKNCKIALDIIWLDENYKVMAIKPNNQPCSATGECPSIVANVVAKYALEINAGLVQKIGLIEGSYFNSFNH